MTSVTPILETPSDDHPSDTPWCLTCGAKQDLQDGRTFAVLSRHRNEDLCDMFTRVLGAEASEDYPSINVCDRCERQLRRLGRYSSLILARHEGQRLREQLEKNLAQHGQTIVESGRDHHHHDNSVDRSQQNSPGERTASSPNSPRSSALRRGQSLDGYGYIGSEGRRSGDRVSNRSSSVSSSGHSELSIEEAAERTGSLDTGSETGSVKVTKGIIKQSSISSASGKSEKRRKSNRRRFPIASSKSEESRHVDELITGNRKSSLDSGKTVTFASLQHRSPAFRAAYLPATAAAAAAAPEPASPPVTTPGDDVTTQSSSFNGYRVTSSTSSTDDGIDPDSNMASTDENKTLVDRSEFFDKSKRPNSFKKRFKLFGPASNKKSPSGVKNEPSENTPSPEATGAVSQTGNLKVQEGEEVTPEDRHPWTSRVNPFDGTRPDRDQQTSFDLEISFDDDVFVKGIVDLDDEDTVVGDGNTIDEDNVDEDNVCAIPEAQLFPADTDEDNEGGTRRTQSNTEDDNDDTATDRRGSLSEAEERINLKTQFKGVYYNIGSTEDLLQEFADEKTAQMARSGRSNSVASVQLEESDTNAQDQEKTESKTSDTKSNTKTKKGKLLKYESLDLDIDNTNPFFDDVYSEYNRRVNAKKSRIPCSSNSNVHKRHQTTGGVQGVVPPPSILEPCLEETADADGDVTARTKHRDDNMSGSGDQTGSPKSCTHDCDKNDPGGQDPDSIPLIEAGDAEVGDNTENKQDENMPFDFLKKKKKEPPQEVGSELQTTPNNVTEPPANDDRLKGDDVTPKDDVSVKDGGDESTPDGQTEIGTELKEEEVTPANGTIEDAELGKANGKGAVTFANDVKTAEDGTVDAQTNPPDGTPVTTKSEKSPLIGKSEVNPSKVKDGEGSKLNEHQPGFLCCVIF